MKLCEDIHGPQRMSPKDFDDPLTFPLAPPVSQSISDPVKYLNIYWMDWHNIWYRCSYCPEDECVSTITFHLAPPSG